MQPVVVMRDASAGQWLRFANPVEVIVASTLADVLPALARVEARVNRDGLHAAGFISYHASPAFDAALSARPDDTTPLVWIGLFTAPETVDPPAPVDSPSALSWTPTVTRDDYDAAIARIKTHIADGDSYQVNYTFRLRAHVDQPAWDLFRALVDAQDAAYSAFIDTGATVACSVSPELFFQLDGRTLTSLPMKGTSPRGRFGDEDQARAGWLSSSEKNRAENVMIVDMIRNDIGRVSDVGSVMASDLFQVERYRTLWQMTSRVTGQTDASIVEILRALFPCASVTGAPKARTTGIIAEIESTPRGLYTGAIGMIAPGRRAQFSVAIRTLVIDRRTNDAEYGLGGGVTWGSEAGDEYEECLTKARVLTARRPAFDLLETLRWNPEDGYILHAQHIARMRESAQYFDRPFDELAAEGVLNTVAAALPNGPHIVRLLVNRAGEARAETSLFTPLGRPVRLAIAPGPVDSLNPMLFHKTTHREVYDAARRACPDADDVLLWNEHGEVTESCIANVVVDLDGALYTPPVECGLLPGTYRAMLLRSRKVRERVITLDELKCARHVWVVNSVRGQQLAQLI